MEPARWERIKTVFQDAFERDASERPRWLDEASRGDADLRAGVEALLAAHASAGSFLNDSAVFEDPFAGAREPLARVGPYRIIRELGRGGMGAVYLGERDDPNLRKIVAIKVVQRDSHFMLRRFRIETQILAALEHPGIARLYDGGTTEDGLPYFVMEYVAGENILAFCDAHQLPIRERLQLFRRVCDAVQFAHQSFIVHRDLKPSNILVTADGEPKLLDFGIAKLLNPELTGTGQAEETIEVARLLTPQYASPEHVRGQPVTTASDVYSLGVILYELLCGARPYRVTAQQSTAEIERTVCDTDPPAPSSVAPGKMRRTLRGDVDNIVLKALQKDPRDRYGTAAELGEDVRRCLDGFPVLAQPDRVGYRAGKFVRRHRAGAAAAAVAIVSLVAGLGGALWQGRVARLERDHARTEAAKTQQIASFLSGVFQSANPILARGKTVTARDLLDRATSSIAPELEKDPDVEASLLLAMSDAYASLTAFDKSAELAERALAIRRQSAPHSIALADALQKLGTLQRRIGQGARGVALLEEALALRETLLGRDDPTVAQTLVDLVGTRSIIGRSEGNREMLERAIAILERSAPTSAALANAYNVLGAYFYDRREFVNARMAAERSIAVFEKSNEPTSVSVIAPLLNLGDMLRQQGDLTGARSRFERVLAINETLYGKESMTAAYALGRLGDLARANGDLPLAHDLLERSLAMYAKVVGPDYYESAEVVQFLGQTLMLERKPREALALFDRAMRMIERAHGPDHPDLAETLVHVARARALVDGPAATEPLLRRALAIQRQALSADSEALVPTLTALGQVLGHGHNKDEARPLLEEAVRIARIRLPERRADRLEAEAALAGLNHRAGS